LAPQEIQPPKDTGRHACFLGRGLVPRGGHNDALHYAGYRQRDLSHAGGLKLDTASFEAGGREHAVALGNAREDVPPVGPGSRRLARTFDASFRNRPVVWIYYSSLDVARLRGQCPQQGGYVKKKREMSGHGTFPLGTQHSFSQ
jgi:hypothetical protein